MYVFLIICLIILLLLLTDVNAIMFYKDYFSADIKYLFFTFHFVSTQKEDKKTGKLKIGKAKAKEKKVEENPVRRFFKEKGFDGAVTIIKELAEIAVDTAKKLMSHAVVRFFKVRMDIAGEDAAKTALEFSFVSSTVYNALGMISSVMKVEKHDIIIKPDFVGEKSKAEFSAKISVKLIFILIAAVKALIRYIKKISTVDGAKLKKAVQKNERSSG